MGVKFDKIQSKLVFHDHNDLYHTKAVLASTGTNDGASLVGIEDAAERYTATTVEGVLTEVVKKAGDTTTGTMIMSAPDLENLSPLTTIEANFQYVYLIGEVIATQNYGSGSFVNDGSTYGFTVYPYLTANGTDYISGSNYYVESVDDGGNDNTYQIQLDWAAVTGAAGYLVVYSGTGVGIKVVDPTLTINSLAELTLTADQIALEKIIYYQNNGYTFNYRAYHYDSVYNYCSSTYVELAAPITDDTAADAYYVVVITYGDDAEGVVTVSDDFNGYNHDQGFMGTNNTAVDHGIGGDISILANITAVADVITSETNGINIGGNAKFGDISRIKGVPYSFPDTAGVGTLTRDVNGSITFAPTVEGADYLRKDENLADLPAVSTARTNLGVYSIEEVDAMTATIGSKLPKDGSEPMTGNLQADEGVLIAQSQQLDSSDMAYAWASTIFAGAGLTNCYAMEQDDNWFYFAGSGLNSGYIFRVNKDDYTRIESVPCVKSDGTLDVTYRMVISNDKRFLFYAGQESVGKIELGSFGQVARFEHGYAIGDTQVILVDDTKVYLMVTASSGNSLIFDQESFALILTTAFVGSSTLRGGTIVGTDMYLLVSKTNSDVIKYDLTDTTLATTATLTLTGNNTAYNCVHDNGFLYVVHSLSPTKVSKVDLSTFTLTTTLTLTSQNTGRSISTDGTYLYVTQYLSPVRITRILISDFATFSTLTAASGNNLSYNTLVYDGYLYTALFATISTFMKTEIASFASPTYHKYGASTSNLSKVAGNNNRQFACALNSANMFFVDYTKRTVKYIEMPFAVSCMAYEALTNFVYAISTDTTSAEIMVLDLGTGELAQTLTPGFSHTSKIDVCSMASSGYLLLINSTNGEGIIYDTINNAIIDTQSGTHLQSISQLVFNSLLSGYVYGIRPNGTVFRISNDLTGSTEYGTTGLATLADVPLSLSNVTTPILTICGKTDRRVFWWDVTGDPDFGNIIEYTVDNVGTLGGAMYSESADMIAAFYQSVSNAQVTIYNRITSTATKYTAAFTSSTSTDSITQLQVDNSGGTTIVNVLCQFGSAYQILLGVNTSVVANVAEKPFLQHNDLSTEPTNIDALSSYRIGKRSATTELIGSEVTALGVLRALFGFITSGFSSITGYVKYMIVENIDVQGRVTVADNSKPAKAGDIRYNTTDSVHQGYDGTEWHDLYNVPYGNMYMFQGAETITVAAADTWYELTGGLSGGEENRCTFQNDHEILIQKAGNYMITWSMSIADGATNQVMGTIMVNGTEETAAAGHTTITTANKFHQISGNVIIALAEDDVVSMGVLNEDAASDIDIEHVTMSLVLVH